MTFHTRPFNGVAVQLIRKLVAAVIESTSHATPFAPVPCPEIVMTSVTVRFAKVMPLELAAVQVVRALFAFVHVPISMSLIGVVPVPPPTVRVLPLAIVVLPLSVTAPLPVVKVVVPVCVIFVMMLPFREMLPEPVWIVPVDAEKSEFARPPAEVRLLPDASN